MLGDAIPLVSDKKCLDIALLFYSHSPLLSQDHQGILNFYNPAAQKVFGYTPEEAIGMPSAELVPHWLIPGRAEKFKHILEDRVSAVVPREERVTKGGKIVNIWAIVFPYTLEERPSIAARVELLDGKPINPVMIH